jgi:hypothetical protein
MQAVDLLLETQQLQMLLAGDYVDSANINRVVLYLLRSADYSGDADESKELLETAFEVRVCTRACSLSHSRSAGAL